MSVTIPLDVFSRLDSKIQSAVLAAINDTAPSTKPKAVKSARKGRPTPHGDFTKKILDEHKADVDAFKAQMKESNPEQKGAHLIFVSNYKKAHMDEYNAFEAAWKEAHPKEDSASETGSVTESSSADAAAVAIVEPSKPKRVMSEDQKAKMKAGREKAALLKKMATEASDTAVSMAEEVIYHAKTE